MRRSVAAAVVAFSTAVSITSVSTPTSSATPGAAASIRAKSTHVDARTVLHRAERVVSGRAPRADGTMALLDLRLALPQLTGRERQQALGLLARPTDHPDFNDEAYSVPAKEKCAGHICIHWVPTTADAPPNRRWVDTMLRMMNKVWR